RRAVVAVLTVAATLLATACGSSGEGTEAHALRLLVPFTPGVWDPRQVSAWPLSGLLLVNEPLTVYQPDGTNAPNLAEKVVDSWTGSSPDPVNMPRNMLMPGSLGNIAQYAN